MLGDGLAVPVTARLGRRFAAGPPSDRHDAPNEPTRFTQGC
jgi:hypothetical protein